MQILSNGNSVDRDAPLEARDVRSNVLFITRDFLPVSHTGTLRSEAFVRYLPDHGWFPLVLTSQVPSDFMRRSTAICQAASAKPISAGKVEPSPIVMRAPWESERSGGLGSFFLRLPLLATYERRRREFKAIAGTIQAGRAVLAQNSISLIYATAPPMDTLLVAHRLGQEHGLPVVADLRDLLSYVWNAPHRHIVDFVLDRKRERAILQHCAAVIVNTYSAREIVINELCVPSERVHLIRNGYDADDFPQSVCAPLEDNVFSIVHTGEVSIRDHATTAMRRKAKNWLGLDYYPVTCDSDARSPWWVLRAIERLIDRDPSLAESIAIWFVGLREEWHQVLRDSFRYPQCLRLLARVESSRANEIICRANMLLLLQYIYRFRGQDNCVAIPAKLYAYLRAVRPILACVRSAEIQQIVENHQAGRVVDPRDVNAIEKYIASELAAWKSAGRGLAPIEPMAIPQFERSFQTSQLAEIFADVVSGGPARKGCGSECEILEPASR